jgi:prevent-host-death family protein
MDSINLKEARRRLGDLVRAAEDGETVVITRRGRRVARLVPIERERHGRLPDLTAFRASVKVKGKPLSKVVTESRRKARY